MKDNNVLLVDFSRAIALRTHSQYSSYLEEEDGPENNEDNGCWPFQHQDALF